MYLRSRRVFGPDGGALVNAASCVLELRHPWCDIFLASLEGTGEHATVLTALGKASSGDVTILKDVLLEMFDNYIASIPERAVQMADAFGSDRNFIEASAEDNVEVLLKCAESFSLRVSIAMGEGPVTCAVGEQSGWLRIRFNLGAREYLSLFAPGS